MSNLDQLIKDVNKKMKHSIVNEGVVFERTVRIPFSSPRLNYMTYGGLPVGRLIEFFGEEGGGKTTTALDCIKNAQIAFPDKKVMLVDCERTFDDSWAKKIGVDVEKLLILSPETETAEQIFQMVLDFIDTEELSLVVIDSFGVMVSGLAYEKTVEEKTYGGISQALTLFSKKAVPICARANCSVIGINQVRDDMNSSYGGVTTTGGRGWKHNCTMRLQFTKSDYIDEKGQSLSRSCENPAGNFVKVHLVKTKVCKPDRKIGFYTLRYLDGIDYITDTIDVAVKEGIVLAAGAWFSILDEETGEVAVGENNQPLKFQGRARLREFLIENPDWFDEITQLINMRVS